MNFRLRFKEDDPMTFWLHNNNLWPRRAWIHRETVAEDACPVMWHEMATRRTVKPASHPCPTLRTYIA